MDRNDESKSVNDPDDSSSPREGDVLGLGGSAVPKMPGDPSTSNDPASVRKRRERALSADADINTREEGEDHAGATGIDMGGGGHGTDVSGR